MATPTALAPTASLATPRVKKFLESSLELFGPSAQLADFFLCEPTTNKVLRGNEKWIEANWGANITADRFSLSDLDELHRKSKTIHIGEAVIHPLDDKLQIKLWLFARVMRW